MVLGGTILAAASADHAIGDTADESLLHQLAGQAASYAGEVQALLARGVNPNVPDSGGRTAVHAAARIGATETLGVLLEAGGNPNVRDKDRNAPLHLASYAPTAELMVRDSISSIVVLLMGGADVAATNVEKRTALHLAAGSHDQAGGVTALLRAGADPNREDSGGETPLHAAVGPNLGKPSVVQALLQGGADPGRTNGTGLTALQKFVREAPDEGDAAALLLAAGADPDRKYPNGEAPLHAAIRSGGNRGKTDVAEALLAGGADPCIRDAERYTPYQIAPEGGAIHGALDRAGGYDVACDRQNGDSDTQAGMADRVMQVRTRSNIRSGPGTGYDRVGLLEPGVEVFVTGEVGEWFRIEGPQGGEAYIFGSLLTEVGSAAAIEPRCAGLGEGAECWQEAVGRPECHVWTTGFRLGRSVRWSGPCVSGIAHGEGTLVWTPANGESYEQAGTLQRGRYQGDWVHRGHDGTIIEARLADGELHGPFSARYAGGNDSSACVADDLTEGYCRWQHIVEEGSMLNGERSGHWTERKCYVCQYDDGQRHTVYRMEGPYLDGEQHVHWVERTVTGRLVAGDVDEGPYVRGKKHGYWVEQYQMSQWNKDGYAAIWEGRYVDGIRQGSWTVRDSYGNFEEGPFVDGERHGRWTERRDDGRCYTMEYSHGEFIADSHADC